MRGFISATEERVIVQQPWEFGSGQYHRWVGLTARIGLNCNLGFWGCQFTECDCSCHKAFQ